MKKISLLVYDFDGTLVDTLEDLADSVNRTLIEMNLSTLSQETIRSNIGDGVAKLMSRSLMSSGCKDVETAITLFLKHYSNHLLDQTAFYPGGREIVEYYSGKKNAILSNKPVAFIEKILEALNFLRPFDYIMGGDSLDVNKPDPKGLQLLMSELNCPEKQVVMIGDSAVDIKTGKQAGVMTCGVTCGLGNSASLLDSKPDYLIDNLSDLKLLFN